MSASNFLQIPHKLVRIKGTFWFKDNLNCHNKSNINETEKCTKCKANKKKSLG